MAKITTKPQNIYTALRECDRLRELNNELLQVTAQLLEYCRSVNAPIPSTMDRAAHAISKAIQ